MTLPEKCTISSTSCCIFSRWRCLSYGAENGTAFPQRVTESVANTEMVLEFCNLCLQKCCEIRNADAVDCPRLLAAFVQPPGTQSQASNFATIKGHPEISITFTLIHMVTWMHRERYIVGGSLTLYTDASDSKCCSRSHIHHISTTYGRPSRAPPCPS